MDIIFPSDWKNGEGWGRWYILFSHLAWSLRGWLKQWHWTNYLTGGWSIAHTCHLKKPKDVVFEFYTKVIKCAWIWYVTGHDWFWWNDAGGTCPSMYSYALHVEGWSGFWWSSIATLPNNWKSSSLLVVLQVG
jgi:hypothetical protein